MPEPLLWGALRKRAELAEQRLVAWMSEDQRQSYEQYRWFSITASDGSPWRIIADGSQSGNVLELDGNGQAMRSYCAHPRGSPAFETYLAQALAIMTDVGRFRSVANVYHLYQPPPATWTFDAWAAGVGQGEVATGGSGGGGWSGLVRTLRR